MAASSMVGLTDTQLKMIIEGARPLHPNDRSEFLREVVNALSQEGAAVGNGGLRSVLARVQRSFRVR
jgi:hypothetical protein